MPHPTLEERFYSKFEVLDNGCWQWFTESAMGYGSFWANGRQWPAHRFAYEYFVGPIPEGLTIDHLCCNPSCINPEHLEPVTQQVNTVRATHGPAGKKALQTHCIYGHEFTRDNTHVRPNGTRACRECNRIRHKRRAAVKRTALTHYRGER